MDTHPVSPGTTSSSFIEGLRANSDASWQKLLGYYAPLLRYWCRQAGIASSDIEDVVQDVLLAISKHIPRFRYDRKIDTFRGWLWVITRRKLLDRERTLTRKPLVIDDRLVRQWTQTEEAPALPNLGDGKVDALQRALDAIRTQVSSTTWTAFYDVVVRERSVEEVGKQLGLSPNAVYKSVRRVLKRLRLELDTKK
ncbi:MAG: sigma-70 family RNA polymerase sigma factor [Planctomycetota bacterium]